MGTTTENYGLHQWVPEDNFIRTDFNEDNAKIDAGLRSAEEKAARALAALERQGHDLYSLLLQNYYDGKYTGYRKALIFDGFLDDSLTAERDAALIRSQNRLQLTRSGQEDITVAYGSSYSAIYTSGAYFPEQTLEANGYLTGWTVCTDALTGGNPQAGTTTLTYQVKVNDELMSEGTLSLPYTVAGGEQLVTLPAPVEAAVGDVLSVWLKTSGSTPALLEDSSGPYLGGVLHFTPAFGAAGTLTGVETSLPPRSCLLGWVRHQGGSVALSVLDGNTVYPMDCTGTAEAVSLQRDACSESTFLLDTPPEGENLAFRLELALTDGEESAALLDYGVLLT